MIEAYLREDEDGEVIKHDEKEEDTPNIPYMPLPIRIPSRP